MSFTWFLVTFAVSAAAMGLWIDVRFPRLGPRDLLAAVVRLVAAVLVGHLGLASVRHLIEPLAPVTQGAIVFAVGFLALTAMMLATIWVLKAAQRMLGSSVR